MCPGEDHAEDLDDEDRSHRNEDDDAKGVSGRVSSHRHRAADGEGEEEGGGHRSARDAATIEGETDKEIGDEEVEGHCHCIDRQDEVPEREAGEDAQDSEEDGEPYPDGEGGEHHRLADVALGDRLHLVDEHIDRRLAQHRDGADGQADDQEEGGAVAAHGVTDLEPHGDEAAVDTDKEEGQADEEVDEADADTQQAPDRHLDQEHLIGEAENDEGDQGADHLLHRGDDQGEEVAGLVHHQLPGNVTDRTAEEAEDPDGQRRPDEDERDQAEVITILLLLLDAGNTKAHRHDERNRKRAGGGTATVEGDAHHDRGAEGEDDEEGGIAYNVDPLQWDVQNDTGHANHHIEAEAQGDHRHQRGCGDGGIDRRHLVGQHGDGRLCNDDDDTDDHAGEEHQPEVLAAGGVTADPLAEGDEADFKSCQEDSQPHGDKNTADGEIEEISLREGGDKEVQQSDEGDHRANGYANFLEFLQKPHETPL